MEHMTRRQKRMLQQRRNDLGGILEAAHSRRFLMRLIEDCGVYSPNPQMNGVKEGMRLVGLTLIQEIMEYDPAAYASLMADAAKYAAREKNIDTDQPDGDDNEDA